MAKTPVFETVEVETIHPNSWNPNVMPDELFNDLAADIEAEGMDQPIVVVRHPDMPGHWMIVDGEHRWRGAKAAGVEKIMVTVKEYTELEQMAHTMRRNVLRGKTDPVKFTELVDKIQDKVGVPISVIREKMSLHNEKEFTQLYRKTTEKDKDLAAKSQSADSATVAQATFVANLSQMIRDLVGEHGDTIKSGYMYFMWKGQKVMCVSMDADLRKAVERLIAIQKEEGDDPTVFKTRLAKALNQVCDEWV